MDSAASSYKWSTWVPSTSPVSSFLLGLPCTLLYMAGGIEATQEPSRQPVSLPHYDHWPLPWIRVTPWGSRYVGKITTQGQQKVSLLCNPPQSQLQKQESIPRSCAACSYRSSGFHSFEEFPFWFPYCLLHFTLLPAMNRASLFPAHSPAFAVIWC